MLLLLINSLYDSYVFYGILLIAVSVLRQKIKYLELCDTQTAGKIDREKSKQVNNKIKKNIKTLKL